MGHRMHQKLFKLPPRMLSLELQDSNLYKNRKSMHFNTPNVRSKIMNISLVSGKIWNSQISCARVNELNPEPDRVNRYCQH